MRYLLLGRKLIGLTLVGFFLISTSEATTYYSVANGNWTAAIWSVVCSTCGPGSALPALVAGDSLIIDNQVTIAPNTQTIGPAVTIIIRTDVSPNTTTNPAKLIFTNGGKLVLTSASSKVVLENTTGNAANNPQIDGTGNGGSNLISIGGVEYWRASNQDVIGVGTLQPGGVLPIKLISFEARKLENSVELKWLTAMERNFSHFEIERATQNLNFTSIARVDGRGGLDVLTPYEYHDALPENGKIYYRLKSVDIDLTFEHSTVVVVEVKVNKSIIVYSDPITAGSIIVHTNFSPQENDHVEIYNNVGLKLFVFKVAGYKSRLHFNNGIKQGSYLLRYVSAAHMEVVRFNIQ